MAVLKKMGRKGANLNHPRGKIICYKCRKPFPRTAEFFHRNKSSRRKDGLSNSCKACTKDMVRKKRLEDPEYAAKSSVYSARDHAKYPEKALARKLVRRALRRGELHKEPCEACGDVKVEGHHPDYSKPLEVVWLCIYHHERVHEELRSSQ